MATILAISMTGCALEERQPTDMLYLHLYSNRYDIHSKEAPGRLPRPWQCIATIGAVPGVEFYVDMPNHYEPEMQLEGTITQEGDLVKPNFVIRIQDVGTAFTHKQTTPVPLNELQDFWVGEEFRLIISESGYPFDYVQADMMQ